MSDSKPSNLEAEDLRLRRDEYQLKEKQFLFEQQKYVSENSLFRKNIGIIITAIISFCAVVVSAAQVYISYRSAQTQSEVEEEKNVFQEKSDITKSANQFSLDVAKFLIEHMQDITSEEDKKKKYVATVVIASFPDELAGRILSRLQAASGIPEIPTPNIPLDPYRDAAAVLKPSNDYPTVCKIKSNITIPQIQSRIPSMKEKTPELENVFRAASEYQLDCEGIFQIFLATLFGETAGLNLLTENMNYSAARILEVFGVGHHSAAITPEEATTLAHQPAMLAERVYGLGNPPRAHALGNTESGDGFKYRGRGYLFTTGRRAYRESGELIKVDLEKDPDLLEKPDVAAKEAAARFANILTNRTSINLRVAVQHLNGGFNGLSQIEQWLNKITTDAHS